MSIHLADEIHNLHSISRDLTTLILGKKIGEGMSRDVYEYRPDDRYVIKVERGAYQFQNAIEWEIWQSIQKYPQILKWFAPIQAISPNGLFLVQEKTYTAQKYPEKVPYFFKDVKKENFGFIGSKFVCHDYGTFLRDDHFNTIRLKKVNWDE